MHRLAAAGRSGLSSSSSFRGARDVRGVVSAELFFALIVVLAIVVVMAIVYFTIRREVAAADAEGYKRGKAEMAAAYAQRDAAELIVANRARADAEAHVRELEAKSAHDVATVAADYEKELEHERTEKGNLLAAVRDGSVVLRDPGASGTGAIACGGGSSGQARAGTGERDGPSGGQLSAKADEFLLGLTSEADQVAVQLGACQAVIAKDREVCGGEP